MENLKDKRIYFCGVDSTFTDIQNKQNKLLLFYWYCTVKEKPREKYSYRILTLVEEKETSNKVIMWYLQLKSWFSKTSEKRHFNINTLE